jgi:hypothetical protein
MLKLFEEFMHDSKQDPDLNWGNLKSCISINKIISDPLHFFQPSGICMYLYMPVEGD